LIIEGVREAVREAELLLLLNTLALTFSRSGIRASLLSASRRRAAALEDDDLRKGFGD
jgi:hypothetical protein